ncbi:MAG: hypothetical protein KJ579_08385 [Verrucomicrobia bacterium]|nr:hypothetical protein [Verrucomicrobiota bacterium]
MRSSSAVLCLLLCAGAGADDIPLRPAGAGWPPVIGAWFWKDATLEPDGFREFLDAAAAHTPYTLLSTSLRISKGELTDPAIREQIGRAVRHANQLGLQVAFDLDVRLARRAFRARFPDEQQEELVLKTVDLPSNGTAEVTFAGRDLTDHMTGGTIPYQCLTTRLVRVYTFARTAAGIDPTTWREVPVEDVRAAAAGPRKLAVTLAAVAGRSTCVIASHTYLTPDVFAPHLLSFQREIVRSFADLPLAGVMKDEWGFPPDHSGNPAHDRAWYSQAFAQVYAERSGGRDLVRDALLMMLGAEGQTAEREAAINRYRTLTRERNAAIEDDFYRAGKAAFGPASFVVTHATWTAYPGIQEFRKHGLDWWDATRDIGQTDEEAPYPCRTSLAKRWGFPLWYNQYYARTPEPYLREMWSGALGGGRLNVHPIYPRADPKAGDGHLDLMRQPLRAGLARLRMLDFITRAPLDCPVAVVFGHAAAMNWAGSSYDRVGLELASALCAAGYPADVLPSTLAAGPALRIDADSRVALGSQRYRAVVLYRPEFGDAKQLDFFRRAAGGTSALFQVGGWTKDADARPLDAATQLGARVRRFDDESACEAEVVKFLRDTGVAPVTAWERKGATHPVPPADGHAMLTDGTCIRIAGAKNPEGDPIRETFTVQGHAVTVDAVGFVAIRFAADGSVAAFAAGGLQRLEAGSLHIELPARADLAFVRETENRTRAVLQGWTGDVPASLLALAPEWQRLSVPPPLPARLP